MICGSPKRSRKVRRPMHHGDPIGCGDTKVRDGPVCHDDLKGSSAAKACGDHIGRSDSMSPGGPRGAANT